MKPKLQSTIVGILSASATAKIYNKLRRKEFLTGIQSHLLLIFRSVISEIGSLFVDNLNMRNRLPSESFLIAIKRKLGIPLIPTIGIGKLVLCSLCNKMAVSRHGDHALSCFALKSQCSKYLHDSVRDATAALLSEYKKIAHSSPTAVASVSVETAGLVNGTLQRPADVSAIFVNTLQARSPAFGMSHPVTAVAFDISFVANITPLPPLLSLDAPVNAGDIWKSSHFSDLTQREALKRSATKTDPAGTANYLLGKKYGYIPLIFDHYGGIGSHASEFLYGAPITRPRNTIDNVPTITSVDLTEALWITSELKNSTVPSDFAPPFHPFGCSNILREMSILGNKDHNLDDTFPGDPSGSVARLMSMQFSRAIAGGAAFITRLYLANPQASGGKAHQFTPLDDDSAFQNELDKLSIARPAKKILLIEQDQSDDLGSNCDFPTQDDNQLVADNDIHSLLPHSRDVDADVSDTDSDILAVWSEPPPVYISDKRLRNAGIRIISPANAVAAVLALRQLFDCDQLEEKYLRFVLMKHDINYPHQIFHPYRVVDAIIKILEQCFRAVAMLPRAPPDPLTNVNDAP